VALLASVASVACGGIADQAQGTGDAASLTDVASDSGSPDAVRDTTLDVSSEAAPADVGSDTTVADGSDASLDATIDADGPLDTGVADVIDVTTDAFDAGGQDSSLEAGCVSDAGATGNLLPCTVGCGWSNQLPTGAGLSGVWGSSPSDVWITAQDVMLHWNGSGWTEFAMTLPSYGGLTSVWGSGPSDVWVAEDNGGVSQFDHWDGSTWSAVNGPAGGTPGGVLWGSGPNDVWSVGGLNGGNGNVSHWDGNAWSLVSTGTTAQLYGIWGSGSNDVWAVGRATGSIILHWNGVTWSPVTAPTINNIVSVWGSGATDVWAVGGDSSAAHVSAMHWDGSAWSARTAGLGPTEILGTVWGSSPTDDWAAG
jgi:hypothetical protein